MRLLQPDSLDNQISVQWINTDGPYGFEFQKARELETEGRLIKGIEKGGRIMRDGVIALKGERVRK